MLGLAAVAVQLVAVVVGSAAGAAPSVDDATKLSAFAKNSHIALTTVLILFLIGFSLFIGFIAGLRAIAVGAAAEYEWLATTPFGAGIVVTVIGFVQPGLGIVAIAIGQIRRAYGDQGPLLL